SAPAEAAGGVPAPDPDLGAPAIGGDHPGAGGAGSPNHGTPGRGPNLDVFAPGFPFLDGFPSLGAEAGAARRGSNISLGDQAGATTGAPGAAVDPFASGPGAGDLGLLANGGGTAQATGPLVLDRPSVPPGGQAVASGQGCQPGAAVAVGIGQVPAGEAVAGPDGAFSAPVVVSNVAIGRHQVVATCDGAALSSPIDVVLVTSTNAARSSTAAVVAGLFILAGALALRRPPRRPGAGRGRAPSWRRWVPPGPRLVRMPVFAGHRRSG
ncbi:MAG TPA: hypothetical protein VNT56_09780, partial [Acidimicrobiales bacterium]|nr:hypothetical protein [Acidimicrobiales bacterium]